MTRQGLRSERRISVGPVDLTIEMPPELADKVRTNTVYRRMVRPAIDKVRHRGGNGNGHVEAGDLLPAVPVAPPQPDDLDAEGRAIIEKIAGQECITPSTSATA